LGGEHSPNFGDESERAREYLSGFFAFVCLVVFERYADGLATCGLYPTFCWSVIVEL